MDINIIRKGDRVAMSNALSQRGVVLGFHEGRVIVDWDDGQRLHERPEGLAVLDHTAHRYGEG